MEYRRAYRTTEVKKKVCLFNHFKELLQIMYLFMSFSSSILSIFLFLYEILRWEYCKLKQSFIVKLENSHSREFSPNFSDTCFLFSCSCS